MYYLFGINAIRHMLSSLCGFDAPRELSDAELQRAYNTYLEGASIIECKINWLGPRIVDFDEMLVYAKNFHAEKCEFYVPNSKTTAARIRSGYFDTILVELNLHEPNIALLIQFVIRIIIVNHLSKYTNGTTEDTLGVANFNFKDEYDRADFEELLFHQLTHMLLFLDDSLMAHMPQEDKETLVLTTIPFVLGGTDFPAYVAFHSYIVAVEMLFYRSAMGTLDATFRYHGSTSRIVRVIRALRNSLNANRKLFLSRGHEILIAADAALLEFEHEHPHLGTMAA